MKRTIALLTAAALILCGMYGCGEKNPPAGSTAPPPSASTSPTAGPTTGGASDSTAPAETSAPEPTHTDGDIFFTQQEPRSSPQWVTSLEAAQDARQLIVVAGVDKTTAYVTMHEKNADGQWQQLISTPAFIGKDGMGYPDEPGVLTPIGTFTIDKAFGLADDPGCGMEYTKVDGSYYWSGDTREGKPYDELVSIDDVPDLDTAHCERIADYPYAYRYVLNMGYNPEKDHKKGYAFFFHSFTVNHPYTGGCVAVPESVMRFIMQHIQPGCRITLDRIEALGGSVDE